MTIGVVGFVAPYLGVLAYAHFVVGWPWPQAQIAGISLSTTSVAVVYAVMIETGFNNTEIGKIILAACFINDLGTVLALGIVFARYDLWLLLFGAVTAVVLVVLVRYAPWMFKGLGHRVSEPQTKFVSLILLALGGLASVAGSEAVLPAYLVGMALAPTFLAEHELPHRMRIIAFSILTPFYFLKAGSLVEAHAVAASIGLITVFLVIKMATKFIGILPLTRYHEFDRREGMYTTLSDVDRAHIRLDLGAVRADQQDHRPDPIYDPGHRRYRQRRRSDPDRADLVPARLQGDRRRPRCPGGRGRRTRGAVIAPRRAARDRGDFGLRSTCRVPHASLQFGLCGRGRRTPGVPPHIRLPLKYFAVHILPEARLQRLPLDQFECPAAVVPPVSPQEQS